MTCTKDLQRERMTLDQIRRREEKWDKHFLGMACYMANMSRDPSTKVGAVITTADRNIVGVGFNGFPRRMFDDPELYADRSKKYPRIVHAEMNAVLNAGRPVVGCTIYVSPLPPCSKCALHLSQAGIARVVSAVPSPGVLERWADDLKLSYEIFAECDVYVKLYDVDPASLVKVIP